MPKTPDQAAADDALEKAVQGVIAAYELVPDGSLLADYLVVGEALRFDDEDNSTCEMFLAFRNGHVRLTTALGVMELGKRHLLAMWDHETD